LQAGSFSLLNKLFDLAPPFLIGLALDVVVDPASSMMSRFGVDTARAQLAAVVAATGLLWGLESLFEYLAGVAWRNLAQTMQHELRIEAYRHVQRLDLAYFDDQHTGELMSILNDDVNQLERFLDHGADELVQMATTVVVIGAAFFMLAPSIAWMAFLPVPAILWGSFRFQRRIAPRYAAVREQAGRINTDLANNLGGITTIKAFTAEDREVGRIAAQSNEYRRRNARAIRLSSAFSPLIRVAIVLGFTATLLFGGIRVTDGTLGAGAYAVLVFLTQRLLWPLTRLGETFDLYQRAMASTERILDLVDTPPALEDGTHIPADITGHLRLHGVEFRYAAGERVLSDIDLEIPAGETTAIVGPTGAGKTTIVKLLLRLYDPTAGNITLDGRDLRAMSTAALRRAFGLVSQDVFLFDGTVADNIAYGRPDATREAITAAARLAEADGFINSLSEGYDTPVGERGVKLSGGQRQRISIARAVLRDPAILVLDEATSAVDNETEAAIQRSLARMSRDRTTVVIAHRLSTVRHAGRIYVLDGGKIAETGTHDELVAAGGIYSALWKVQTGTAVVWETRR
ncbi:MAG: ABC transporter ATP-binding protein, partial [Acidimicrobiia bacterium]